MNFNCILEDLRFNPKKSRWQPDATIILDDDGSEY
jgi:hypothetical protein